MVKRVIVTVSEAELVTVNEASPSPLVVMVSSLLTPLIRAVALEVVTPTALE